MKRSMAIDHWWESVVRIVSDSTTSFYDMNQNKECQNTPTLKRGVMRLIKKKKIVEPDKQHFEHRRMGYLHIKIGPQSDIFLI